MDIIGTIIPVVTFVLGYLLSWYDRIRESRQRLTNLRSLLRYDLADKYKWIRPWVPDNPNDPEEVTMIGARFIAICGTKLSFSVFETYLERLDTLTAHELDKVYRAYKVLQGFQEGSSEFTSALSSGTFEHLPGHERTTLVWGAVSMITPAYDAVREALEALPGGKSVILESDDRGSSLHGAVRASQQLERP